jgi:TolB-like protein/predicted Zn-dependent protease
LQDEITVKILKALQVKLTGGLYDSVTEKGTNNLEAYLKLLRAREYGQRWTKEGNAMARQLAEEAIALDPGYAMAHLRLSATHLMDLMYGSSESPKQSLRLAEELVQKALALDANLAEAHAFLGRIYLTKRQYEKAIAEGERAVVLQPNSDFAHAALAFTLRNAGRHEEAIALLRKAIRLNPFPRPWYLFSLGYAHFVLGQYKEAAAEFGKALQRAPESLFAHLGLAATYSEMGRAQDAQAEATEILRIDPKFTLESHAKGLLVKNKDEKERYIAALRKAGLPDKPQLPLPDNPSIAVLPFVNMSGDPEQEYFADGMTDDLITDFSKISGLFVIARNSAFTYKGKPVKIKRVSRELGVRYVLEGSVRKVGDRVRINAQLIDATTGGHLWAERYDGNLGDVFALQDKVTRKIVAALAVKLTTGEQQLVARRDTDNVKAYDEFLRGREHYRRYTSNDVAKAVTYFKKAITLDPNYTRAHAWLATAYWASFVRRWAPDLGWSDVGSLAKKHLEIAMENPIPEVHRTASWMQTYQRQYEEAIAEAERAMALNPNDADNHYALARVLIWAGRSREAIDLYKRAMRLDPYYPAQYLLKLGLAQFCVGDLENAATTFERARKRNPGLPAWPLAATYAYLGREQEAAEVIAEYMKRRGFKRVTVKGVLRYYPFKDPKDKDRFADGLRKAGLK